jgi:hypothetical protein
MGFLTKREFAAHVVEELASATKHTNQNAYEHGPS